MDTQIADAVDRFKSVGRELASLLEEQQRLSRSLKACSKKPAQQMPKVVERISATEGYLESYLKAKYNDLKELGECIEVLNNLK